MWKLTKAEISGEALVDSFADLSSQFLIGNFGTLVMQCSPNSEEDDDDEVTFEDPVVPRKNRTMWDRR